MISSYPLLKSLTYSVASTIFYNSNNTNMYYIFVLLDGVFFKSFISRPDSAPPYPW